jgi:hypothetical protein
MTHCKLQDLDILCLSTTVGAETLKRMLVSLNDRFYLIPARNPRDTYKVLWYCTDTDARVKVDLLMPGVLGIPSIPPSCITCGNIYSLPCAPLSVVLLLKLQAWVHHGEAVQAHYRLKKPMDERDINALLPIASRMRVRPKMEKSLPESFVRKSESRVEIYVREVPASKNQWKELGYEVRDSVQKMRKTSNVWNLP